MFAMEPVGFGLIKLSVLFFYRRIFVSKKFSIVTWSLIGLIVCWMISFFFSQIFICSPVSAGYGTRLQLFTQCGDTLTRLRVYTITDIITDVMILSTPIPMVVRLHTNTKRKVAIIAIFLMGALSVAAGAARFAFYYIATTESRTNPDVSCESFDFGFVAICSNNTRPPCSTHLLGCDRNFSKHFRRLPTDAWPFISEQIA